MIATDQDSARAYAKTAAQITGEPPTVVLSDEKAASKKIAEFTDGDKRWMVAVRMVSEGVDVPRLAVGVYATTTSTPLFFAQAVGRFVRARNRGETASVFLPSVPSPARLRLRDGGRARPRARPQDQRRGRHLRRRGRPAGAGERRRGRLRRARHVLRGARLRGALRPGALRRRRVRPRGRGARRLGGGDGLPRHPRAARARPDARAAPAAAERPGQEAEGDAEAPSRTPSPRSPRTSSSRSCAASSTGWSPPGTTAPARRTASPTPRCARSAAARPPPSPPPTSCRRGSTGSATGRPASPPDLPTLGRVPGEISQTLDRGLRVLDVLAASPDGLTMTELAARMEVNRTIVHRLVARSRPARWYAATPPAACGSAWVCCGSAPRCSRCCATSPYPCCASSPRRSAAPPTSRSPTATRRSRSRWSSRRGPTSTSATGSARGTRSAQGAAGKAILLGRAGDPTPYALTVGELQSGARGLAAPVLGVPGLEASVGIVTLDPGLDAAAVGPQVERGGGRLADTAGLSRSPRCGQRAAIVEGVGGGDDRPRGLSESRRAARASGRRRPAGVPPGRGPARPPPASAGRRR